MEERSYENSEVQGKTKTIGIDQIIILEETPINLINHQVMNKYSNHDYIASQLLNCGVDNLMTSKKNSIDLMTQHRLKGIRSVNNTKSSDSRMSS
jgi:hypothetical protein